MDRFGIFAERLETTSLQRMAEKKSREKAATTKW